MTISNGLHHVTAIASDAQRNLDFYSGVLGLRLVKLTVNFDDPTSYHLYYGDQNGTPGTILTFFSWPGARRTRQGRGEVVSIALAVPRNSLDFWREKLKNAGVQTQNRPAFDGSEILGFSDPDGLNLELVASENGAGNEVWTRGGIEAKNAIQWIHHVQANVADIEATARVLTQKLGLQARENGVFVSQNGRGAIQLLQTPDLPRAMGGVGSVHHVAFRAHDAAAQREFRADLVKSGFNVSPVMDRSYFESIYFREPSGVLLEIATDGPGFATDETLENLGTTLKLPPQFEGSRAQIEANIAPLVLPAIEVEK